MMMQDILRSGSFRIAVAFAAAVVITTYSVFAFVYWRVRTEDMAQISSNLRYETAQAAKVSAEKIQSQLELRLTDDLRRLDYAALYSADNTLIYGNIKTGLPVPVDGAAHAVDSLRRNADGAGPAILVAQRRADGGVVLLGRTLVSLYHLESIMRWTFLAAILPTIFLALALGVSASLSSSRRLTLIQLSIERVMQGELAVRLPSRSGASDLNRVVAAVNLMLDEIVRLMNQIKSVGDNIAHDLRAPLAAMYSRLEIGVSASSPDVLRAASARAMTDLESALRTVTALLRISELESSLQRRAFATIDLVDICHDIRDMFEPLAAAKGIAMTTDLPAHHMMLADGDLLREVLANLIDNAIKFTPAGGAVSLTCDPNGAILRVADTGPGIALAERDEIFKRFYRSPRATGVPGVGLGLSMASTIVALHGYRLVVGDNKPGAVFEVVNRA